jgi:hypothetical protein
MTITFVEPPASLESLTNERAFQSLVVDALRLMGWVVIALEDARVGQVGIPDLLCFRGERGQMIELKIRGNTLSKGQRDWRERWLPTDTDVPTIYNRTDDWTFLMELMA